ncbi:hypothetical protein [Erysipelothrix urinaevulpis]|uniref:hypothetical protein n=1 Tax=Erysipelothrix urinaevulpis TaxID=2683717 RepID=UPI00135694F1|nr:hypothetical protein [Erysipelothrix urinaevulpis]
MQVNKKISIGIIGADTTHVSAFVEALTLNPEYSQVFEVLGIYDDALTQNSFFIQRKDAIKTKLKELGFECTQDDSFLKKCDGLLILTGDASVHLKLFKMYAHQNQAVFIDKPATYDRASYQTMVDYATKHDIAMFSSSAMRFAQFVQKAKEQVQTHSSVVVRGPLSFIEGIPDYHWYGIHLLEMLDEVVEGPLRIKSFSMSDTKERIIFHDETKHLEIVGIKVGNPNFEVFVDDVSYELKDTLYVSLLKEITTFIQTKESPVKTTGKIMNLLEEINLWKSEASKND